MFLRVVSFIFIMAVLGQGFAQVGKVSCSATVKLNVMQGGVNVESKMFTGTADVTKACHAVLSDFPD